MNKNTVKPGLTRKRAKRSVENSDFDAFARRILRAYGRRVAGGDIEALRALTDLSAEIDAVTRLAVAGLRAKPYAYSWADIADRLGVSRQAAQMRYGERSDRPALDRRLVEAGLSVSVATLVHVFAGHFPGTPQPSLCPGCGYRYPDGEFDCPTVKTVRPLLFRRRNEDQHAVATLTPAQLADLHGKTARLKRTAPRRPAPTPSSPDRSVECLFDLSDRKDSTS